MTSTWKEAWESENMAQNAIGLDERTMQNMCTTWPPWMELSLGIHADHPKLCDADPPDEQLPGVPTLLCNFPPLS